MRCERAQEWMTVRLDHELSSWRSRRLDRHLAICQTCAAEEVTTERLFEALASLPVISEVPELLEERTLRAIRVIDKEQDAQRSHRRWWSWMELAGPVTSAAAVLVFAVHLTVGEAPTPAPEGVRVVSPQKTATRAGARGAHVARRRAPVPTLTPPPDLAANPDLFVNLPILRQFEKVQHFDSIRSTNAQPNANAANSNG